MYSFPEDNVYWTLCFKLTKNLTAEKSSYLVLKDLCQFMNLL